MTRDEAAALLGVAAERFDTFDAGLRRHEFQSPVDGTTTIPTATP
jgi:hypothetical protein